MTTDDDRAALAAGYALGSLTPEEKAEYEAYLAESPEHRREAAEFDEVAGLLAADAPHEAPAPGLKERLMAQVATTPQRVPESTDATGGLSDAAPAPETVPTAASERARRRWFRRPAALSVAAAVAALLVFGGGLVVGTSIRPAARPPTAQVDTLAKLTTAADVQRRSVSVTGGGEATLVWSASLQKAAVITEGMPAAPAGKTYQLWFVRGASATSAGLMTADAERSWKVLSGSMRAGDAVGITIEPAGGSQQPTTKPVAVISP